MTAPGNTFFEIILICPPGEKGCAATVFLFAFLKAVYIMAFEDTMWDLKKSDRVFSVAILRHVIFPGMGGKRLWNRPAVERRVEGQKSATPAGRG
ncbi:hypothetical protein ACLG6S_11180 [Thermodesulfobacteriota bacterium B35]